MDITMEDPWLGKRSMPTGNEALIKDQLKLLEHFRDDGREPSQKLLDDIDCYKWLLKNPDKIALYFKAKEKDPGYTVSHYRFSFGKEQK